MTANRLTVAQLKVLLAGQDDDTIVAVRCCTGSDIAHVLQAGSFESSYGPTAETFSIDPKIVEGTDGTLLVFYAEDDYVSASDDR